jgi:CubicO group peptidase (beta-lactamase class C family)
MTSASGVEPLIDRVAAETYFSGAVRVDAAETHYARAYGNACRPHHVANTIETQFAIASGTKGMTALAVMSLVDDGILALSTTARSVLGADLPLIADDVTVEHLLGHRSGIGDYLDEDLDVPITTHMVTVPVQDLEFTEQYLAALDGFATKFPAGAQFSYCNGGFIVLALVAERVSGVPYHDLVRDRVCGPAGMRDTEFLRSDDLPARAAIGYLGTDNDRTNVLHLPIRGNGDGGIYSTLADMNAFWDAFLGGRIVRAATVRMMITPRSRNAADERRYGLGMWIDHKRDVVFLEGYDAGVSFRSAYEPASGITYTVMSNTSEGAWPIVRALDTAFFGEPM